MQWSGRCSGKVFDIWLKANISSLRCVGPGPLVGSLPPQIILKLLGPRTREKNTSPVTNQIILVHTPQKKKNKKKIRLAPKTSKKNNAYRPIIFLCLRAGARCAIPGSSSPHLGSFTLEGSRIWQQPTPRLEYANANCEIPHTKRPRSHPPPSKFGILFGLLTESLSQNVFRRVLRFPSSSEGSDSVERMLAMPYEEHTRYVFRDSQEDRREIEESRPLCEEVRKSFNIRELIYTSASTFLQSGNDYDLRKYNLIPRKVDIIKCASKSPEERSTAVCKPDNCKERKVDIEVFGRLKNETGNVWEYMGTLSAVPIACECFIRWKPEKCLRSYNIFSEV